MAEFSSRVRGLGLPAVVARRELWARSASRNSATGSVNTALAGLVAMYSAV